MRRYFSEGLMETADEHGCAADIVLLLIPGRESSIGAAWDKMYCKIPCCCTWPNLHWIVVLLQNALPRSLEFALGGGGHVQHVY